MVFTKGWIFETESEAQYYCDLCTEYYSPLPEGWVWINYIEDQSRGKKIILIAHNETLDPVLIPLIGEPYIIEIDDITQRNQI